MLTIRQSKQNRIKLGLSAPGPEMSNCKKIEKNQKQNFCINAVKREDDIEIFNFFWVQIWLLFWATKTFGVLVNIMLNLLFVGSPQSTIYKSPMSSFIVPYFAWPDSNPTFFWGPLPNSILKISPHPARTIPYNK